MDPIGFALDNFDADGKWRAKQGGDGGTPIDASVTLFDGQQVDGPAGLRQALLRYSPQFVRMFTEKMMTYALGRGVEYTDMPALRVDRAGRGEGQQPVLGDRAGHRQEPAVPDASEGGKRRRSDRLQPAS